MLVSTLYFVICKIFCCKKKLFCVIILIREVFKMSMTEKIKIVLIKRRMSAAQLAERLGYSSQNIYNKFSRDNFSVEELQKIAEMLDCTFEAGFTMNDTGERV